MWRSLWVLAVVTGGLVGCKGEAAAPGAADAGVEDATSTRDAAAPEDAEGEDVAAADVAEDPREDPLPVVEPTERPSYTQDDALRVNDLTMRCTHNSYHVEPPNPLDDSHRYTHAPLLTQLDEQGIRAFELDIHPGDGFPVYHIPFIDDQTTCATLRECLGILVRWSEARPGHHLVVVWIEIKDELNAGMKLDDYDALDALIRTVIPPERLLEPAEVQGAHASLREALRSAGWPTLGASRDQVLIALLEGGEPHQRAYTYDYTSLDGRAMFAQVDGDQLDLPWAAVAKINNPADADAIRAAKERNLLIASNVCSPDLDDAACEEKLAAGLANGVHMLCDDLPAPIPARAYHLAFSGGQPSVCNADAPASCTPADLEALP